MLIFALFCVGLSHRFHFLSLSLWTKVLKTYRERIGQGNIKTSQWVGPLVSSVGLVCLTYPLHSSTYLCSYHKHPHPPSGTLNSTSMAFKETSRRSFRYKSPIRLKQSSNTQKRTRIIRPKRLTLNTPSSGLALMLGRLLFYTIHCILYIMH